MYKKHSKNKFFLEMLTLIILSVLLVSYIGGSIGNFNEGNIKNYIKERGTFPDSSHSLSAVASNTIIEPTSGWEQYQGNSSHNGFTNSANPKTNTIVWTHNEGGSLDGLISNSGVLIVSNPDNGPYVGLYENNGSLAFVGSAPSGTSNSGSRYPSSGDGMFFGEWYTEGFFSTNVALGADSIYNGQNIWSTGVAGSPSETEYSWSSSAIYGGYVIYEMQGSSTLEAFQVATGTQAWASNLKGSLIGIPTVGDNKVLVGYSNLQNITAISLTSGVQLWNIKIDGNLSDTPSFASGNFYFGTTSGSLYSVNNNGRINWIKNFSGVIGTTPVISNGTIYFGDENGYIYALNVSTGDQIWSFNSQSSFISSPAVSNNGFIDEATISGTLFSLYSSNGTLCWELNLGATITASPVLNDGLLFLVSTSGTIYAIGTPSVKSYTVTFTENGLPPGVSWSVTLNGITESSTTNTITFTESNGTYTYTIGPINGFTAYPSSGVIDVNGANVNETIAFTLVTFTVTFTESGLPAGIPWYVNITGQSSISSTGNSIKLNLSNGSYYYTVSSGNKIYKPSYQGSFTVRGAGISEPITFSEVTYTVTFSETGLLSGSSWSVTLNGTAKSSIGNISFIVPNGTYSYSIASIPGYSILSMPGYNGSSGVLTVSGYNLSHPVTFVKVITNGYLTGSISPSNASIWVNGTFYHAVNGQFNISLKPGTYEVKVSAPGYYTYNANITIRSSSVSKLPIQSLTEITKPMSFPLSLIVLILVLIVAIIAVAIVVIIRKRGREP